MFLKPLILKVTIGVLMTLQCGGYSSELLSTFPTKEEIPFKVFQLTRDERGQHLFLPQFPKLPLEEYGLDRTQIVTLTLADNLSSWPQEALSGFTHLEYIYIYNDKDLEYNDSEITISEDYFKGISKLKVLQLPHLVTAIKEGGFRRNSSLFKVDLSHCKKMTTIAASAFDDCSELLQVKLPPSLTSIGALAFYGTPLTHIQFPSSLITIEDAAFDSSNLTSVTFPSSLTTIKSHAFAQTDLISVTLPASIITMGAMVFSECKKLEKADLSACTKIISIESQFKYCPHLTEIIFPSSIANIGEKAFEECDHLLDVTWISRKAKSIHPKAFCSNPKHTIHRKQEVI